MLVRSLRKNKGKNICEEKFKHKFINYSEYSGYRMKSTVQLSPETKTMIGSFGIKGETFETIIKRIYSLAVKEQLREFLMSSENCISLEEFKKEIEEKWPRSK